MRIGVISDTHGLLRPEAVSALEGVDHILHAGDIGAPQVTDRLARIAPTTAVRGNVDRDAWALDFPWEQRLTLGERTIHLQHILADLQGDPAAEGVDIVVTGHSHQPKAEERDGVLYLNPGSAGPRRFRLPIVLATLDLAETPLSPRFHTLVP